MFRFYSPSLIDDMKRIDSLENRNDSSALHVQGHDHDQDYVMEFPCSGFNAKAIRQKLFV